MRLLPPVQKSQDTLQEFSVILMLIGAAALLRVFFVEANQAISTVASGILLIGGANIARRLRELNFQLAWSLMVAAVIAAIASEAWAFPDGMARLVLPRRYPGFQPAGYAGWHCDHHRAGCRGAYPGCQCVGLFLDEQRADDRPVVCDLGYSGGFFPGFPPVAQLRWKSPNNSRPAPATCSNKSAPSERS